MVNPICHSGVHRNGAVSNGVDRAELEGMSCTCPAVPDWVMDEFIDAPNHRRKVKMTMIDRECIVSTHALETIALVSVHLPRANELVADEFRRGAGEVYHMIRSTLAGTRAPHPVRMWNFIPGIHHQIVGDLDRYRVFNQARHTALLKWLGGPDAFASSLPAATGIGHGGDALVVHALATAQLGRPLENPRQTPAFRYSRRWGPQPPCFSRAVIASMPDGPRLLIGGTASVRGEESVQTNSLAGQLDELLDNLRCLLVMVGCDERGSLDSIRDVRMYYRRREHRDELCAAIAHQFVGARRVDSIQADICRRELLVEIEGVAELFPRGVTRNGSRMNHRDHVAS
jgi:chorismate lyase / 3-hydroxybenzoate synthase